MYKRNTALKNKNVLLIGGMCIPIVGLCSGIDNFLLTLWYPLL